MARAGFGAGRLFGNQQPLGRDPLLQRGILGRIDDIDPAGDHRDRAGFDRSDMRGGIDPARQAGNDRHVLAPELGRQLPREPTRRRRGIARADHRDRRPRHQLGASAQHHDRRCVVEFGKQRGIIVIAQKQMPRAEPGDLRQLAFGKRRRRNRGRFPAAPRGKLWQRFDCRRRGAKTRN